MELLHSLLNVLESLWELLLVAGRLVIPYAALMCWIAFWLLAVNWENLYSVFWSGGWIGIALLTVMVVFIWGVIAPPETTHDLLGMEVSNFVGKFVKVAALVAIMFLCGAVQLSGAVNCCVRFDEPAPAESDHDDHGRSGHGHDSHAEPHSHGLIADHH
jgi:hypothetical protein